MDLTARAHSIQLAHVPRLSSPGIMPWVAPILLLPIAAIGPNAILALYACGILGFGTVLLRRPGETPILLLIFLYQWVQAAIGLFYGNVLGDSLDSISPYDGRYRAAVFLLLTGLLVLALAIRITAGRPIRGLIQKTRAFVGARPLGFWLSVFIGAWMFSAVCGWLAWHITGLRLPLLALANVQWGAFVLLTLATFAVPGRSKKIWLTVFCFEFAMSVGGYFSEFKLVFIYALLGVAGSNERLKVRVVLPAIVLILALLSLGVVWTGIKGKYRDYVNEGTGHQVVLIDYPQRVAEIGQLAMQLNGQDLSAAADQLIHRLMYFAYFGVVLDRVPDLLPYAGGKIWGEAIIRPFMPRILFPNKSAIHDSQLTNYYTGLWLESYSQGTSISMGYMADAYIDFGWFLMFFPIAALGLFIGFFYRWLLTRPGTEAVLGVALATFSLLPALALETSALKLVPALILSIFPCLIVLYVLGPALFRLSRKRRGPSTNRRFVVRQPRG